MKQQFKRIRRKVNEQELLQLDLDYWLASLHDSMRKNDEAEIDKCKQHLKEIKDELDMVARF